MKPTKSPAVVSLEQEKAAQSQTRRNDEVEVGLEDTFPASDPVSATSTASASSSRRAAGSTGVDAPLVDEALASVRDQSGADYETSVAPDDEIRALRSEISDLNARLAEIGSASVRVAKAQTSDLVDNGRRRIQANPMRAVGLAALAGYVWGLIRS